MLPRLLAVFYVVLWASAYVPSKIGATAVPPLWFLVARFLAAGVLIGIVSLVLKRRFPASKKQWLVFAALGVLANAAYLGLTYTALGRGLEFYDQCAVEQIAKGLARNKFRFSALINEVVKSVPFQSRRGEETPTDLTDARN